MKTAQIIIHMSLSPFHHFVWNIDPVLMSVVTFCGLDGPGVEFQGGGYLPLLSRLALGPTQPPVQYILGLFPVVKAARVRS